MTGSLDDWLSPSPPPSAPPPSASPPSAPPPSASPPSASPPSTRTPSVSPSPPVHAKAALPTITVEEMLHQLLHEQRRLAKQQTMHTYATTFVSVVILAYLDRILHRLPPRR